MADSKDDLKKRLPRYRQIKISKMVGMTHFQDAREARDACDVLESGATKIERVAAAGRIFKLSDHGRPTAALDAGSEPMFSGSP